MIGPGASALKLSHCNSCCQLPAGYLAWLSLANRKVEADSRTPEKVSFLSLSFLHAEVVKLSWCRSHLLSMSTLHGAAMHTRMDATACSDAACTYATVDPMLRSTYSSPVSTCTDMHFSHFSDSAEPASCVFDAWLEKEKRKKGTGACCLCVGLMRVGKSAEIMV